MEEGATAVTSGGVTANITHEPLDAAEHHLRTLMVAALEGDDAAYRALLYALGARLRAFFRRRLGQHGDETEDLVQETLLAIHNQRDTYDAGRSLTAWVYAIAHHKLVDHWRRHARSDALNVPIDDIDEPVAESAETSEASGRDLLQLLEELPDRHRLPIVHVKIEGHSIAEAARMTGMSESAVKVGIHRGLRALAALVRKRT